MSREMEQPKQKRGILTTKTGAAGLSILSNSLLVALKVVVGLMMGSVSVLSEGIHSGVDLLAALIAFFSVRAAAKPADREHEFGHGKIENVSGIIEAVLIFVAAGLIIYQAVGKILIGARPESLDLGIGLMAASAVVNWFVSRHLHRVARLTDSVALEADAWHLTTDVYTSVGVFAGLLVVRLTGWFILDPLIAIAVAVLIIRAAWSITRKSFGGLMDTKLPESEEEAIRSIIIEHSGQVVAFHELRTRKAGSQRYVDLHLVMPQNASVYEAHRVCDHLEQHIGRRLQRSNITIHIEPCTIECHRCSAFCVLRKRW